MPKEPRPEMGWEDITEREAVEGAHAEKPFRDALVDYKEGLSEEANQALDWIASEEGEKAIEDYRKKQGDERIKARELLKQKALMILDQPTLMAELAVARHLEQGGKFLEWAIRGIAETQLDSILESSPPKEILEKLFGIANDLRGGLNSSRATAGGRSAWELVKFKDPNYRDNNTAPSQSAKNGLRGFLVGSLLMNRSEQAMYALDILTSGTESEAEAELKLMLPILEHWQASPAVDIIVGTFTNNRAVINRKMQEIGLVWNPDTKKYLKI